MPILKVPHVTQNGETHCGVACLEMIYRYFGITEITQDDIWEKKKTPRTGEGTYIMRTETMANDLFENGFQILMGQFSLDIKKFTTSLQNLLESNTPIIACKQASNNPKYGHFVVIVGMDKDNIFYLDPDKEADVQQKNIKEFIEEWKETGEEVVGGEFIAMGKDDKPLRIKKLHLTSFWTPNDLTSFYLESLDFKS